MSQSSIKIQSDWLGRGSRWFVVLAVLAAMLSFASPAYAAGITVTTTADIIDAAGTCATITLASLPGPGGQTSLREAVCAANNNSGPDTVSFSVNGTFALTGAANEDNGGSGDLDIKQSLALMGNGAANTIIDGSGIERIFDVFPSAASTFDISSMTIQNGDTRTTSFKEGGAIYLHNNVTTTVTDSQIINNFSGANGAIENRGTLTINGSVISNNQTLGNGFSVTGGGIHNVGALTINNTTIRNNMVTGEGGGIFINVGSAVTVNISNSTISGNVATTAGGGTGNGGGIATTGNAGMIIISSSTISGNRADQNGGGAYWVTPAGGTGNVTLTNVTMTNNTADYDNNGTGLGGGFAQTISAVTLHNTIVAGNFNSTNAVRDDISGAIVASSSYNLIGDGTGSTGLFNGVNNNQVGSGASPINPLLGALANNGGPTETHELLSGSPAVDMANNVTCPATDQRGVARPINGTCDIGSFELNLISTTTTITSDSPDPSVVGQVAVVQYSVTSAGGTPTGNVTVSDGAGNSCMGTVASGSCQITFTSTGSKSLTATYAGLGSFGGSSSAAEAHQVDKADTNVTITSDNPDPSPVGQGVTVQFSVAVNAPGSGTPTGNVTVSDGVDSCTGTVASGTCLMTLTTSGNRTLTATYLGDGNFNGSTSAGVPHMVSIPDATPPDTTITSSPSNPSNSTSASFSFNGSDADSGVASFECKLDGGSFTACTSPQPYSNLALGSHTFQVRAIDAAGNIDPTPASYTWQIHASTTLLYTGGQIVNMGSSLTLSAKLSSSATACTTGQAIRFALDDNPTTATLLDGPYLLGLVNTNGSGIATQSIAGSTTAGWLDGIYAINVSFAGTSFCEPSSDQATLTVASPGNAATGGGWYTLSGSGRINFGFTVRKADSKCTSNCAYKGQLLLINNGKWRLKGNLTSYSKTATGQGAASGTGDLYWWDPTLNGGLGDWALAQAGVSYTINFYDSGKSGKLSTDKLGIRIVYTPVSPQPATLPNSTPQLVKGGDIKVQ